MFDKAKDILKNDTKTKTAILLATGFVGGQLIKAALNVDVGDEGDLDDVEDFDFEDDFDNEKTLNEEE